MNAYSEFADNVMIASTPDSTSANLLPTQTSHIYFTDTQPIAASTSHHINQEHSESASISIDSPIRFKKDGKLP